MSNDLVPSSGQVAMSQEQLLAGLGVTAAESKSVNSEYLQFSGREGRYSVSTGSGNEPADFPVGTKVYLNIMESKKGYVCWKEKKAVDRIDCALFKPLPPESSLEDHGPYDEKERDGWKMFYTAFLKDVASGKQYQLQLSSPSATRAFGALIQEIIEQAPLHNLLTETPVIVLGVESFKSNGYKNYKPKLDLVEWAKNPSPAAAVAAPEASEAPALEDGAKKAAMPSTRAKK